MARQTVSVPLVVCRTTDVSDGSGVMGYTVGARAICVELET
ncbi:hypothetical protein [Streptomyces gossypii]|nr:hypothetical protein [Streptomyces gossypii]